MAWNNSENVVRLIKLMVKIDMDNRTDLLWYLHDGELHFDINCSDVFAWGSADVEPVEPEDMPALQAAMKDASDAGGAMHGCDLWVARKRQQYPQKPYYRQLNGEVAALFDDVA